jgi:hypothetical protein
VKKAQLQANSGTWIVSEFACVSSGSFSRQIGQSIFYLRRFNFSLSGNNSLLTLLLFVALTAFCALFARFF